MEVSHLDTALDDNRVATVLDSYGTYLRDQGRASSLRIFEAACKSPVLEFGNVRICDLKVMHVQQWLDKMGKNRGLSRGSRVKKWGPTQKRIAIDKLITALNWAVEQGTITRNPIRTKPLVKDLKLKGQISRGKKCVLEPGEHSRLVALSKPYFADLLTLFEATGCRPGEAHNATAAHHHREDGTMVFPHDAEPPDYVHKTAKKTEKDRMIYLTPALVEMVERLACKNSTGPLFRNRDGRP
jgi:integrase